MGVYSSVTQRPPEFELNPHCQLATGLVFAGLGRVVGSTHYRDSSPYGNHGTLAGFTTFASFAQELNRQYIPGVTTGVSLTLPAVPSINSAGTGPLTFAAWIRYIANAGSIRLIVASSGTGLWSIDSDDGAKVRFRKDWSSGDVTSTAPFAYSAGVWDHLAITWNAGNNASGTDVVIYKNGVSATPSATTTGGSSYATTTAVVFGLSSFSYDLSDSLLYSRALSPAEIKQLADPSNVMLSGLILPPRRRLWGVSGAAPAGNRRRRLLIAGVPR